MKSETYENFQLTLFDLVNILQSVHMRDADLN